MIKLRFYIIAGLLIMAASVTLFACLSASPNTAASESSIKEKQAAVPGAVTISPLGQSAIWIGSVSGQMTGDLKMVVVEHENLPDYQKIKSNLSINNFKTIDGYNGTIRGVMKGLVKEGEFEGTFTGRAQAGEGNSDIKGKFLGTFSDTKGSGTWRVKVDAINTIFTGDWLLQGKQKIE